jgi:polar amino acid transport system substrate-binding protein
MQYPTVRRLLQVAGLLTLGLLLSACSRTDEPSAPAPAAASAPQARSYAVGTDASYAPFESQSDSGEIVGFDIELMRAIAEKGGFEVRFVDTPWNGLFDALGRGERDLLVSAIAITDERKQTMDFSDPYFDAVQLIAVRRDSKVARFADLKPLKVGVQNGTSGDEAVSELLGATSIDIVRFESTPLALKELEAGKVDAVVADSGVVAHYLADNPGGMLRTVSDARFVPDRYGIAVHKGHAELLAEVNKGLAAIRADGSYDRIYAKYFGAPAAAAAPAPAASR